MRPDYEALRRADKELEKVRLDRAEAELERLRQALRTIRGPEDRGPWVEVYRAAGGGYEGLQAIAEEALR